MAFNAFGARDRQEFNENNTLFVSWIDPMRASRGAREIERRRGIIRSALFLSLLLGSLPSPLPLPPVPLLAVN